MTLTKEQIRSAAMNLNPVDRESLAEVRRRDAAFCAGMAGAKPVDEA